MELNFKALVPFSLPWRPFDAYAPSFAGLQLDALNSANLIGECSTDS